MNIIFLQKFIFSELIKFLLWKYQFFFSFLEWDRTDFLRDETFKNLNSKAIYTAADSDSITSLLENTSTEKLDFDESTPFQRTFAHRRGGHVKHLSVYRKAQESRRAFNATVIYCNCCRAFAPKEELRQHYRGIFRKRCKRNIEKSQERYFKPYNLTLSTYVTWKATIKAERIKLHHIVSCEVTLNNFRYYCYEKETIPKKSKT